MSQSGVLSLVGGTVVANTITGNTGGALAPSGGNWNILTAGTTVEFAGSGSTLTQDFQDATVFNLGLGSEFPSLSSGTSNTSLGYNALDSVSTGSNNVCIGALAGDAINTGNENVFVGRNAGGLLTGAGQNVIVGNNAGNVITGGSSNILIGNNAGNSMSGTCSNNINIGATGSGTVSNQIRIGSSHTTTFIDGITGVTVSASAPVGVDSNDQLSSLGFGTSGQVLTSNGAGSSPTWQATTATGTFTPTMTGSGTAGTATYSVQAGTYTRVGRNVFVQGRVYWTAHTGTGSMVLGGLPFSVVSIANVNQTLSLNPSVFVATTFTNAYPFIRLTDSTLTGMPGSYNSSTGAWGAEALGSSGDLTFQGWYQVA